MSSEFAIRAVDLKKRFTIGGSQEQYSTLRDVVMQSVLRPFRAAKHLLSPGADAINEDPVLWALDGVSFEVAPGEVVGVIGRNGAGKSVLLKILSRITEPTEGFAEVRGRVGSLLEVGTGFHPELTGRENIFLNGAILGMKRTEIAAKFDEIVAFAEVEKFVDTPVKRYSSGMYLRLAFGVAAHLEPEILLVDEVLAVGDAQFQKKCIGKIGEVANQGRTVLFVSHNMAAINALCDRVILLSDGKVAEDGHPDASIRAYIRQFETESLIQSVRDRVDRKGDGRMRFTDFWLEDESGERIAKAIAGKPLRVCMAYEAPEPLKNAQVAFNLQEELGDPIVNCNSDDVGAGFDTDATSGTFVCTVEKFPLRAGRYTGDMCCTVNGTLADWVSGAFAFDTEDGDFYGTGRLVRQGKVLIDYAWGSAATD